MRPTIGRELLLSALAMAERGPRLTIAHVSCALSCLSDPARWDHRRRSRGLFCEHNGLRKPVVCATGRGKNLATMNTVAYRIS